MTLRYNIRLSGASRQGLTQAARILAEAAAIYERVLEFLPGFAEARGNLAVLDAASGDAELAAAELIVVIRDNPNLSSAYANLATAYLALDHPLSGNQRLLHRFSVNSPGR